MKFKNIIIIVSIPLPIAINLVFWSSTKPSTIRLLIPKTVFLQFMGSMNIVIMHSHEYFNIPLWNNYYGALFYFVKRDYIVDIGIYVLLNTTIMYYVYIIK